MNKESGKVTQDPLDERQEITVAKSASGYSLHSCLPCSTLTA